jgi:hypothetical protein
MQKQIPERAAYSLAEFAAALGKHPTWAYRRAWKGDIAVISGFGKMLVPVSELKRVLGTAKPYNPQPKKHNAQDLTREAVAA